MLWCMYEQLMEITVQLWAWTWIVIHKNLLSTAENCVHVIYFRATAEYPSASNMQWNEIEMNKKTKTTHRPQNQIPSKPNQTKQNDICQICAWFSIINNVSVWVNPITISGIQRNCGLFMLFIYEYIDIYKYVYSAARTAFGFSVLTRYMDPIPIERENEKELLTDIERTTESVESEREWVKEKESIKPSDQKKVQRQNIERRRNTVNN